MTYTKKKFTQENLDQWDEMRSQFVIRHGIPVPKLPAGRAIFTPEELNIAADAISNARKSRQKALQEYIDSFKDDPEAIIDEIDKKLYSISREDHFYPFVKEIRAGAKEFMITMQKTLERLEDDPMQRMAAPYIEIAKAEKEAFKIYMQETCYQNYIGFYNFLLLEIQEQTAAWLYYHPDDYDTIIEHIQRRATDPEDGYRIRKSGVFYEEGYCRLQEGSLAAGKRKKFTSNLQIFSDGDPMGFTSIFQGPGTNQLALFSNKKKGRVRIDPKEDIWSTKLKSGDYELKIKGDLAIKIGCLKLLLTAQAVLSHQNEYKNDKVDPNLTIKIPLKDYIEKNRKKVTRDNVKNMERKIDHYLETLFEARISWKETTKKGKKKNYKDIRIIEEKGVEDGYIEMTFSKALAVYLINSYVAILPLGALLAIDEQHHSLAFPIFQKMALQYSNDRNTKQGNNNILLTTTLMEACGDNLSTYEEVITSDDRHVDRRISDRVIKELNYLQDMGFIHWHFCNAKNTELDPDQLDLINDDGFCPYDLFKDLRIWFEIVGAPDQSERRQRNDEKKAKQQDRLDKALAQQKAKQILKEGK